MMAKVKIKGKSIRGRKDELVSNKQTSSLSNKIGCVLSEKKSANHFSFGHDKGRPINNYRRAGRIFDKKDKSVDDYVQAGSLFAEDIILRPFCCKCFCKDVPAKQRTSSNKVGCSMSGQAILLNHAIMVSFSVFLIFVVTTTFVSIREDYQEIVGGTEVKELCFIMRASIDRVYMPVEYNVSMNTSFGSIEVRLPERITDLNYRAVFFNKSILIESADRKFNDTCKVGFNANYNGSTSGGLTRFSYLRYTNGTNVIEMVRV